jgi:tRNA(Arg) A34 adenosine deaminase TadA
VAGVIAGYGPSRVNSDRNPDAHAERVALWDAQTRLGRQILDGAVVYATSRPCAACQRTLATARVERMLVGPTAEDAGPPQGGWRSCGLARGGSWRCGSLCRSCP